jgi:arylsulfatase A
MKSHSVLPAAAAIASLFSCDAAARQPRPNVLLILTDDQAWGDVHIHGNPQINTPALDSLYRQSAVLSHFYVSPLSALTRASLLTGRYHLKTGVSSVQSGQENMNPEETTLAEVFRAQGYATGCFGKWHNGSYYPYTPNGQGFDEFLGFCCGHWANYFNPALQHNEEMTREKGYISDIFTDKAIEFISRQKDRPFFCYLAFNAPHSPFQVPDEYWNRYRHLKRDSEKDRNTLACIYAMVENIDHNISRILSRLDELNPADNTIVIFMSDNGPAHVERYNGNMRGTKGQVHEGGVRVPCFIRWRGKIKHRIIEEPAAHIDIMPTILDMCGIHGYQTNFPMDGLNISPLIRGETEKLPERNIHTHRMFKEMKPYPGGSRSRDYRLCVYEDSVLLYNIRQDPSETVNLFDRERSTGEVMLADYSAWYADASRHVHVNPVVPAGYRQATSVRIPAPEGKMHGQLKCLGYPNQNWVNHFQAAKDSLTFELDVVADGLFAFAVEYNQQEKNASPHLVIDCASRQIRHVLPEFVSVRTESPDRVKRDEAYEQTWGLQTIGEIKLNRGRHVLKMFVEDAASPRAIQIKTILLTRKQ